MPQPLRVAHLSDLHVTEGPRLAEQAEDLERITNAIIEARPHLVLLTGDYYGRTVPHRPTPRERAVLEPAVVRMAEVAPVVVLEGNHDHGEALELARLLGGAYPIRVVRGAETFTVFTEAGPVELFGLAYPSKRWMVAAAGALGLQDATNATSAAVATILRTWSSRIQRIRQRHPERPVIALAHATIRGSVLAGGEVLAGGGQEVEIPTELLLALAVDYGALGHIHKRQELAPRWWYVGNPWCVDYGEGGDDKGWHLITINGADDLATRSYAGGGGVAPVALRFTSTGSRHWMTLDYRWVLDDRTGEGRWVQHPQAGELREVAGAHVRVRLVVPDQAVACCPWDAELEKLRQLGAQSLQVERTVEPTMRVRAPEVAAALELPAKALAYWNTLATQPTELERDVALAALVELETLDDEEIDALTSGVLVSAGL